MKLRLLTVGRTATDWLRSGELHYEARIGRMTPFEYTALPDVRVSRSAGADRQKEIEGSAILAAVRPGEVMVLLDEKGKEFTSREFAGWLSRQMSAGVSKGLTFVIGGPYGFSDAVYSRASQKIALSRMTFTHEMARVLLLEQIYRGLSILRGSPYHHD